MNFFAAGIQMDILSRDKEANLQNALERIETAASLGARLVCLPEMFTTAFDYDYVKAQAETIDGETVSRLRETASRLKVHVVSGSFPEKEGECIYNTSVLIDSAGDVVGRYRKIHLFPLMQEDTALCHGKETAVMETELGKIGIMICYDIRFPELARALALNGAQIIVVPAQFPYPRLDHWRSLLQARAIENQLYILAVNRVGKTGNALFFGHSVLFDPWGEIVAGGGDEESLLLGGIDVNKVGRVREKIPVFRDRHPELYS